MPIMATFFEILTSNLFYPLFTLKLMGKPILKSIKLNLATLAHKNFQKTKLYWPYLKKRFFHSASHIWSNNLSYNKYFSKILFAVATQPNFSFKNEARFFI